MLRMQKMKEPVTDSKNILGRMKPGDVIIFHKKGINPGSLGIKLANFFKKGFSGRGWTHAGLYLGDDSVIEAYPDGIVTNRFSEKYLQNNYGLLALRHKNAADEKLRKAMDFCVSEKGEAYDKGALLYFILLNFIPQQFHFILNVRNFSDRLNDKTKYFCSELVARGFEEAGLGCFERVSYKIMPSDFCNPLLFEEIARVELPKEGNAFTRGVINVFVFALYLLAAVLAMLVSTFLILVVLGIPVAVFLLLAALAAGIKKQAKENSR